MIRPLPSLFLLTLIGAPVLVNGQSATGAGAKPTLTEADYTKFETLGTNVLSPDGKWLAYSVGRGGGGGGGRAGGGGGGGTELHYRNLTTEVDKTITGATAPTFSSNSRLMLYNLSADAAAGGRGRGAGGGGARGGGTGGGGGGGGAGGRVGGGTTSAPASRSGIGVLDLTSGQSTIMRDVQSYVLSSDGHHIALRPFAAAGARTSGLVIRDLDLPSGTETPLGNVAELAWSEDGATLAVIFDFEGKTGNSVQLFSTKTNSLRQLEASEMSYQGMRWRRTSDDLMVLRSRADSTSTDASYTIVAWKAATSAQPTKQVYDFGTDPSFPKDMRVTTGRAPQWSDDGRTIFFGIGAREPVVTPAPAGRGSGPTPAKVEVWHWKDLREFPQQRSAGSAPRTHLVAWKIGDRSIVRLTDDQLETAQLAPSQTFALAGDEAPYFMEAISGRNVRDVYTIDVVTGKRTKVFTKVPAMPTPSPSGRYLLYTQSDEKTGTWVVMDLTTGAKTDLTGKIKNAFMNMEDDHPIPYRRGYGVGGWITGEKAVILYDRFDLWQVNLDGTNPVRLTRGKEDSTVYRIDRTGASIDERTIDPSKPLLLTATGEFNKKDGFSRLTIGQPATRLLWVDKSVGALTKARDAEVYTYTVQSWGEPPQLHVSTKGLTDDKQITHANDWLKDFAWGKQTLMNYTNKRGDKLQMMLTYPADYQPGKKYPMVVYYYEKLSQGFHSFTVPTASATYNITVFSQAGYFVLRPDIQFQARDPGYSGLDCVTAAVKTAEAAVADIDAKHVGAMGHSWGGYQSAFYAVHNNSGIFATAIAGAPLTDLISMYGYSSGNTGSPETGHFEPGQERMQVTLWQDPAAYIRNSTVFHTDSLKIPLLLEEGDADGNVNYYQSMELYNFGRRLGKEVVFLVYEGENHSPTGDAARDYHQRQLEWFAHYLKGEPAADWIANGESYQARQKLLRDAGVLNPPPAGPAGAPGTGGRGGRGGGGGLPRD